MITIIIKIKIRIITRNTIIITIIIRSKIITIVIVIMITKAHTSQG